MTRSIHLKKFGIVLQELGNSVSDIEKIDLQNQMQSLQNSLPYDERFFVMFSSEVKNKIIGLASFQIEKQNSPNYEKNKNISTCSLSIHPRFRRQGLGTKLLSFIANEINKISPSVLNLEISTTTDSGLHFLEKHKAQLSQVKSRSKLFLQNVNWIYINNTIAEFNRRSLNVKFHAHSIIPENRIQEFSKLYTEIDNQQPRGIASFHLEYSPDRIRDDDKNFAKANISRIFIYSTERNGDISGFTEIIYPQRPGDKIGQGLTGVKKKYRGRNLGKVLKCLMLLYIKENFQNAQYITTANAEDNPWMLSINKDLGYEIYSIRKSYLLNKNSLLGA